MAQKQWD